MTYAALANQYFSDEQNLALQLRNHLVNTVGWAEYDLITDNAADYDVVLLSNGETPANNDDIYLRIRGNGDNVQFRIYTAWDAGLNTGTNEMYVAGTTILSFTAAGGPPGFFWVAADLDRVIAVSKHHGGATIPTYQMIYAGLCETAYTPVQDPYPVVLSQDLIASASLTGTADAICHYLASGQAPVAALNARLNITSPVTLIPYQQRGSSAQVTKFPLCVFDNTGGETEVRGFLKGLYTLPHTTVTDEDTLTVGVDTFYIFRRVVGSGFAGGLSIGRAL